MAECIHTVEINKCKACYVTSKVTAPQDAHKMLVLQVYLGSNTSVLYVVLYVGKMFVSRL